MNDLNNYMQLGGMFIVAMGLLRVVEHSLKYAWEQRNTKNGNGKTKLPGQVYEMIRSIAQGVDSLVKSQEEMSKLLTVMATQNNILYEMHNQKDEDGRPVWWNTRESARQQQRMYAVLEQVSTTQSNLFTLMSEMNIKIGTLDRREVTNPGIRVPLEGS